MDPEDIARPTQPRRNVVELLLGRLDTLEQSTLSIQHALASSGIDVDHHQHSARASDTSPVHSADAHPRHESWEIPGPSTMPSPEPDEYAGK